MGIMLIVITCASLSDKKVSSWSNQKLSTQKHFVTFLRILFTRIDSRTFWRGSVMKLPIESSLCPWVLLMCRKNSDRVFTKQVLLSDTNLHCKLWLLLLGQGRHWFDHTMSCCEHLKFDREIFASRHVLYHDVFGLDYTLTHLRAWLIEKH
jgi:hypothetical protein